ncbi:MULTISPECIES: phosphate/phosphite/phosphonate ABC transporter substrate-binding protein [unclassified Pseudodesulfovibrio]|uniref:phosphate/phosphite/phosphonate ABC transporter substrate-binding protein n=1 Tax=unclassified Pseudodesulfovibrio TaxID=2661612 RepID=UPI000FEB8C02|nr:MULTISPECIES: phosphate/phosphite/phosphonate ABC transporter substrate-binding protein [unclassified Pseudodesulfovibrio]MCJ2163200.1 phosphate/phosphite/phosphonate ABC transporter substrate-binding protein [Pseudodesulfovibrio sp. S3-i]RWU07184.1 phosphonate ABC transporter substrate-binding protein [Pseudodesulfovibrio sp. S3]
MKRTFAMVIMVMLMTMVMGTGAMAAQKVRLAVTDLEGMEELQREFGIFRDKLGSLTGYEFEFSPVNNRTAAVEALKSKRVDFVLTGPAEYVVFKKRVQATPVVGFSRPDYFGSIIVLSAGGINSVKDLIGEKVAMGDVGSTSKHLAPMQILQDNGLNPLKDIKTVHVDYKVGFESLKRGDVKALGTTNDKFMKMRAKDKQLSPGAFKVIARGPDLPNDVLLVGPHVDKDVIEKVRAAFRDHGDEMIAAILTGEDNQKYKGMVFLPEVKDSDYNYVRAMYATIGYPQYSEFVGD